MIEMTAVQQKRFWAHILKTDSCWNWMASVNSRGYGTSLKGKLVHRISYELANGQIAQGLEIDHLCMNKRCVNPNHLEAVSHTMNVKRAWSKPILQRQLPILWSQVKQLQTRIETIQTRLISP